MFLLQMEFQTIICRLCLKRCNRSFEIVEEHEKNFSFLLLTLNLKISHEPVICENCMESLQKCVKFKKVCLSVEENIVSYARREQTDEVDLKILYLKLLPDDCRLCRFCMEVTERGHFKLLSSNELDVLLMITMLDKYFPEMNLQIVKDPVICVTCQKSFDSYFNFIINCLTIEEKIRKYCEMEGTKFKGVLELSMVACFMPYITSQDQISCDVLNTVKPENDLCETDRDYVENIVVQDENKDNSIEIKIEAIPLAVTKNEEIYNEAFLIDNKYAPEIKQIEDDESENSSPQTEGTYDNHINSKLEKESCAEANESCEIFEVGRSQEEKLEIGSEVCQITNGSVIQTEEEYPFKTRRKYNLKNPRKQRKKSIYDNCDDKLLLSTPEIRKLITRAYVSGVRMYKCGVCGHVTKRKSCMNDHVAVHQHPTQLQLFTCPVCSLVLKTRHGLHSHMVVHKDTSEVKMYKCDQCDFQSKFSGSYSAHVVLHRIGSERETYQCADCPFQTRHKKSIRGHVFLHRPPGRLLTRSEVYKCAVCFYQTKKKCALRVHVMTHRHPSETVMYKCDQCPYDSKFKYCLDSHKQIHNPLEKCKFCPFQSRYRNTLRKHKERCHKRS